MNNSEIYYIIQELIADFHASDTPVLTPRDTTLSFIENMSLSIVGARRSGKTYRTYQFINEYMKQGGEKEDICRIQFNDHRLAPMTVEELSLIDKAYYTLYPRKSLTEEVIFIFDEIHRIDGWEDYILHLLDIRRCKIIITGSTSKLLKGEIASSLRGKNFSVQLYPFSFREFIRHYAIKPDMVSSSGKIHLLNIFNTYLSQGGFPGLLNTEESLHKELLQNYWDTMLLRDIIEAHADESMQFDILSYFAQALVARTSCPVTINSLVKTMRETGYHFSADILYRYLQYLQEAFIIYTVPVYATSERIVNRNYRKLYVIDWALAAAVAPIRDIDSMRRLENIVFIELKRRKYDIFYYRTRKGFEIDFICVPENRGPRELYQVCYRFDDKKTLERELRGIPETARYFGIKKAVIITHDSEDVIECDGITIQVIPVWKWLLS